RTRKGSLAAPPPSGREADSPPACASARGAAWSAASAAMPAVPARKLRRDGFMVALLMFFSDRYSTVLTGSVKDCLVIAMKSTAKSRGGRPWSFERQEALEKAMRLFWRHGYEGVSVGDLTREIGIAPPSLYAAFGSKAELYREALKRYEANFGSIDRDRKSTRLNSSHVKISYAVFCLKKKTKECKY